jgi:Gram-negative bacterial TonB protein C-terminal
MLDRQQVKTLYEQHGRVLLFLRSIPELDRAAIDAVLQWVYEPTLLNGEPIDVKSNVTINFTLR